MRRGSKTSASPASPDAGIVQGLIKDTFALWLNQHPDQGEKIAMLASSQARTLHAVQQSRHASNGTNRK